MRAPLLLRAVLAVAATVAAGACGPPPSGGPPSEYVRSMRLLAEGDAALAAGRWDEAARVFAAQVELAARDEEHLGGWRDHALYNLACAEARAGRRDDAAAHLAASLASGLRPPLRWVEDDRWEAFATARTLPWILADPDLDGVRDDPRVRAALAPYLAAGAPRREVVGGDAAGPRPAFVVLGDAVPVPERDELAPSFGVWAAARDDERPAVWVALAGPTRTHVADFLPAKPGAARTPVARRWLLEDGDERWAVAKVREALDLLAADARVDAGRVYLAATGADPGAVVAAWAAALAMPERVAGVAVPDGTFHEVAWADALHAAAARREGRPWIVLLGGAGAAEPALRRAGLSPIVVPPGDLPLRALANWR